MYEAQRKYLRSDKGKISTKRYQQSNEGRLAKLRYRTSERGRNTINKCSQRKNLRMKLKLINILGNRCSNTKCLIVGGCVDFRCLQFDHIKGGGRKDVKEKGNHRKMIQYYINHPEEARQKLQLLCANCNWIKKYDNGENSYSNLQYPPKIVITI